MQVLGLIILIPMIALLICLVGFYIWVFVIKKDETKMMFVRMARELMEEQEKMEEESSV